MSDWVMIGVPSSAGAHYAGQEQAPDALRAAGLAERLIAAGESVADAGNLPVVPFAIDYEHPGARNLPAVAKVGRAVADSVGIAHLLGQGAPELTGLGGTAPPLLEASRLAILGCDPSAVTDTGRAFLTEAGVSYQEAPALIADPAGAAARALSAITPASGPIVVHFDVDVIDSGELPLGNFPHYGSGVQLKHAVACLRVLRAHPSFAGLILTEVNPTHDADGRMLASYIDEITSAILGAESAM